MTRRRLIRILLAVPAIAGAAVGLLVACSPYGMHEGYDYRLIKSSVLIDAPADSVYAYLGNSDNAGQWSVFVDHIAVLNADSIPDGQPGSRRRCYQQADQKGIWWDETVTVAIPPMRRQLVMNTLYGFPMTAPHLATEQEYFIPNDDVTELAFTLFFKDHTPGLFEQLKMYAGAYKVHSIFKKNLRNIKREVERRMHR
jgi:hypothetical protein